MEFFFMCVGGAICAAASVGLLAIVAIWSVEKVLKFTKLTGVITAWYVDKARKERDAKRIPG